MTVGNSGTGTGMDNSIPKIRDREGNGKKQFPKLENKKGMKKTIPEIREWKRNEKIHSHNSGTGIRGFFFGNGNSRSPLQIGRQQIGPLAVLAVSWAPCRLGTPRRLGLEGVFWD